MSYSTDPATRKKIDRILRMNASIRANLGTRTAADVGTETAADQLWIQWLVDIRDLDPEYYQSIASNEEKDMVTQKIYSKRRFRRMQEP